LAGAYPWLKSALFSHCPPFRRFSVEEIFFALLFGDRRSVTFHYDRLDNLFGQRGFFDHRLLRGFLALADQLALELQPRAFLSPCNLADH
jgi:hypothetical protein